MYFSLIVKQAIFASVKKTYSQRLPKTQLLLVRLNNLFFA